MARASYVARVGAGGAAMRRAVRHEVNVFRTFDRNVWLLLLFTLGKGLQLSITNVTTNLYALSLGYQQDFIGVLTAMSAIGAFVAAIPVGMLADRIGRKPLLLLSGFLNPLSLIGIGLSTNAPLLLGFSLANGILASAYWVTNIPLLSEYSRDDQRVAVLGMNNFLLLGVGALGALIGGFVPEVIGAATHVAAFGVVPLRWGLLTAALVTFLPALPLVTLREPERVSSPRETTPVPAPGDAVAGGAAMLTERERHAALPTQGAGAGNLGRWALVMAGVQIHSGRIRRLV